MKIREGCKLITIAGEQAVIMKPEDAADLTRVIMFNKSAALLWERLVEKDFTPETCAEILSERYNVEFARALEDVKSWLSTLKRANAVESFDEAQEIDIV